MNMSQYQNYFPGKEDIQGAAAALLRLQDTYRLETKDIADGTIEGVSQYRPVMSGTLSIQHCVFQKEVCT